MGQIRDFLFADTAAARQCGVLPVGAMASGMRVELPYVAVRGGHPGKTLWLHGQVHGDEINGMVAALQFARDLDPTALHGNIVVTPTGNPHALDARRKRNPYDELDLDQCYPGSAGGLISERLANALFEEVRGCADMLVNLHTMNPLFDSKIYAVYKVDRAGSVSEETVLKALSLFGPNVACRMDVGGQGELPGNIAGALDYQCVLAGIPSFMLELGGGSRYEAHNVDLAKAGFQRLAQHLGILSGKVIDGPSHVRRVTRRGWLTFDHAGLFVPQVQAGDTLDQTAVLGEVMDLHGRHVETIALDRPGIVIGLRRDPVSHTGERAAFVAWEWDTVEVG